MRVNVAVTPLAASIVTAQAPVPGQAPLHPANVEAPSGVAVSDTTVPGSNEALQVTPQLIPAGTDVTVPPPVPVLETLKV